MAGNKAGGKKAYATNIERHGEDYYRNLGRIGGKKGAADGVVKGFALNPALAVAAGAKGGRNSSRAGIKNGKGKSKRWQQGLDELKAEVNSNDDRADVE